MKTDWKQRVLNSIEFAKQRKRRTLFLAKHTKVVAVQEQYKAEARHWAVRIKEYRAMLEAI